MKTNQVFAAKTSPELCGVEIFTFLKDDGTNVVLMTDGSIIEVKKEIFEKWQIWYVDSELAKYLKP